MQGHLRNQPLSVAIQTKCRHCDQAIHIDADSDMNLSVREDKVAPLLFMPDVDWNAFTETTIIDSY